MTDTRFQDLALVAEDRLGKDQAYLLESGKIRSDLNWSHHVTLEHGLQETLAWVDTHLDALKELPADYIHKP
jgi:dTDP-glucose 4,6-dehydratase